LKVVVITRVELEIERNDELMLRIMSLELVKTKTFNIGTSRFVNVNEEMTSPFAIPRMESVQS